jgi:hypothetical protein
MLCLNEDATQYLGQNYGIFVIPSSTKYEPVQKSGEKAATSAIYQKLDPHAS